MLLCTHSFKTSYTLWLIIYGIWLKQILHINYISQQYTIIITDDEDGRNGCYYYYYCYYYYEEEALPLIYYYYKGILLNNYDNEYMLLVLLSFIWPIIPLFYLCHFIYFLI